ncbi:amidase family protein [Alicyclobacillus sp. ALC3]|uniref:amidase family protein n=1 Tax=Alicyclobacillus sp. ALC3 TaxID=2796143 RepID=UPI002378444F|nr:amidase family protein [Alicyclobacillus sp. ALC3]
MSSLYRDYDATALSKLVKAREVEPKELVEQAITEIERINPKLNAVTHKMYEQARKQAETVVDAPFAGVPILLKDMYQEVEGEPMTFGSRAYQGNRATEDSLYTRQMRQAGFVFLGYTNVPEFALMAVTEPEHNGPTRNPWSPDVTPGGSSGGSAAAVAAGMVPLAGASDGGGSIRIPAAYCGLFGLKPTRGRTPVGPQLSRHWQGASVSHVLTKSVRDSAAVLDALITEEKGRAFLPPRFDGSYLRVIDMPHPRALNVAFSVTSPLGTAVDPACRQAVLDTARLFELLGHHVTEATAPVDGLQLAKSYITMYFAEVGAELMALESILGRKVKLGDVEPTTWMLAVLGKTTSAAEFVMTLREWDKAAVQMEAFHETYDLYLTPTTAMMPAKIGELAPTGMERALISVVDKFGIAKVLQKVGLVDTLVQTSLKRTPFTQLANLTGQPAMSVPMYRSETGMPVGVQVIAARGREDLLLLVAAALEQTPQWLDVRQLEV